MPKLMNRRASKTPGGTVLLREGEGGITKIRCPKCHNVAVRHTRQDGVKVLKCRACGAEFSTTRMSA